jgi:hypothetical protein
MIFESLRQAKPSIRNTFGINRYNTRLNFYLFIISKIRLIQQKSLYLNRSVHYFLTNIDIKKKNKIKNLESLESTLIYYNVK